MKRCFLFVTFISFLNLACAQTLTGKLEEYMQAYAKHKKFNGVVLVAKDNNIVLHKGYGWRDAHKRIAHDERSIFQTGSITKQFTAVIILHLQEKGKLNVQDKLSKYIPGYPNGDKITLHHLLTHTSGVFNYTNDPKFMNVDAVKPIDLEKLIDVFKNRPLDFEPGSKHSYSNSGYILLGHIIEKVSGKPYEQMVSEVIFRPAQMLQSGFDFKALSHPGKSTGYFVLDHDTVRSTLVDSSVSYAAGSIYSTAADLYQWHKALYTEKVIRQSSLKQAFTPFKNDYGYGWIADSINGKRVIWHNGGIFGFTSNMWRVPEDGVCIILLSNRGEELNALMRDLFNVVYDQPYELPKERKEIKVSEDILQQYVGEYELQPGFTIRITVENGSLKGQATNQPKLDFFAERENYFFLKIVDAQIEFLKNAEGKIDRAVLYQGGAVQTAKKIK